MGPETMMQVVSSSLDQAFYWIQNGKRGDMATET